MDLLSDIVIEAMRHAKGLPQPSSLCLEPNDFDFVGNLVLNETQRIVREHYRYSNGHWYMRRNGALLRYNPEIRKELGGHWEIQLRYRDTRGFWKHEWRLLNAVRVNGRNYMPPRPGRGKDETWWAYCS